MIRENFLAVKKRVKEACLQAKRNPASITIVAVSKGRSLSQIEEAAAAGISDIGENRVQEASVKFNGLRLAACGSRIKWHLVGRLQTNKAKAAVGLFGLIHSLDSLRLGEEINRQAAKINKVQDVLVEVKTSPETTKAGIAAAEAADFIKELSGFANIKVRGLMTIAPLVESPAEARPYFRRLRELKEAIDPTLLLSMGMSDDFEAAIAEGADLLRIGRAIFEV